jgi:hypothetical protein
MFEAWNTDQDQKNHRNIVMEDCRLMIGLYERVVLKLDNKQLSFPVQFDSLTHKLMHELGQHFPYAP